MEISVRQVGSVVIFNVEGEIDLYNAQEISEHVKQYSDDGYNNAIINMDKVPHIDSSGIGALITSMARLKKAGGGLKLVHVYQSVRKIFELTKLEGFFDICESEEEALTGFGETSTEN